jgi:hypothetical protein
MTVYRYKLGGLDSAALQAAVALPVTVNAPAPVEFIDLTVTAPTATDKEDLDAAMLLQGFVFYSTDPTITVQQEAAFANTMLTGPQGPAGADGAQGDDGVPGRQGVDGAAGAAGAAGSVGPPGPAGEDGADGPPGAAGSAGAAGATGAQGPVGPAVFLEAEPGQDGDMGPPGPAAAASATATFDYGKAICAAQGFFFQ